LKELGQRFEMKLYQIKLGKMLFLLMKLNVIKI
jgi:hypothetical protein